MKPLLLQMSAFGAYADEQSIDFTLLADKTFFLIYGPTGSGKTTILDAICYALYGTASGDLRDNKSLRSDYASPEQPTTVSFTFTSRQATWQVIRSPEQVLKKQRGEGTRTIAATAALFKLDADGNKEPVAAKPDAVTKEITSIIGFKAEQFRQIVLLPQGEFRRFIIAESEERKTILETIFRTEIYRHLEEALEKKRKEIKEHYDELKQKRLFILENIDCTDETEATSKLQKLATELQNAQNALTQATLCADVASAELNQAQQQAVDFTEAQAATADYENLLTKKDDFNKKRLAAEAAEAAALIIPLYDAAKRTHQHCQKAQDSLNTNTQLNTTAQAKMQALQVELGEQLLKLGAATQAADDDAESLLQNLSDKVLALTAEAAKLDSVSKELERLAQGLEDGKPCPVCGSTAHPHPATVSAAEKKVLDANLTQLTKQIASLKALQQKLQIAQRDYNKTNIELQGATAAAAQTTTAFNEARLLYKQALDASVFAGNQQQFLAVKLTNEELSQLKQSISAYDKLSAAATDRKLRADARIAGKQAPDLPAFESKAQETSTAKQTILTNIALLQQTAQNLSEQQAALDALNKAIQIAHNDYATAAALAETARGDNPARLTFSAFVLQAILDDVLQAANLRLNGMSRGRFSLERNADVVDGRRKNGLNINVNDTNTGLARPVKTLSGGELFLASLSLALGLSDVVQAYAGGIRLDTILVDEGFGTLDPEALDMAIRTLADLQKGGRLVGIISHVAELRERIPAGIEVVPTGRGSTTIMHV